MGNANHSNYLSQWQKSSLKYEMEVETGPQPDVVQQQQIQAFLANVEELTRQNEELWKTMESQNAKRRRTGENQNEEE